MRAVVLSCAGGASARDAPSTFRDGGTSQRDDSGATSAAAKRPHQTSRSKRLRLAESRGCDAGAGPPWARHPARNRRRHRIVAPTPAVSLEIRWGLVPD